MYLVEDSIDDLMHEALDRIFAKGVRVESSTKGANTELTGVLLELRQPRARLSRTETKGTIFSCLGELLWYLAGSERLDFITYYLSRYTESSDDGISVHGAYGPRLLAMRQNVNQIKSVIELLGKKPSSRQAVIQLFNAEDILEVHKDVPCTCVLQFLARDGKTHLVTYMRSNDAFLGLPHDTFAFTFIQELVARTTGTEVGTYKHFAGSLHLYDRDVSKAQAYLKEAWQDFSAMPPMPIGNPWPSIEVLLNAEREIRETGSAQREIAVDPYWADLIRLLKIFANTRQAKPVSDLRTAMASPVYDPYIEKRIANSDVR
jgi:thymidylate synthase